MSTKLFTKMHLLASLFKRKSHHEGIISICCLLLCNCNTSTATWAKKIPVISHCLIWKASVGHSCRSFSLTKAGETTNYLYHVALCKDFHMEQQTPPFAVFSNEQYHPIHISFPSLSNTFSACVTPVHSFGLCYYLVYFLHLQQHYQSIYPYHILFMLPMWICLSLGVTLGPWQQSIFFWLKMKAKRSLLHWLAMSMLAPNQPMSRCLVTLLMVQITTLFCKAMTTHPLLKDHLQSFLVVMDLQCHLQLHLLLHQLYHHLPVIQHHRQ